MQSEKAALSKTLTNAQATAADAEKRLAEIEAALGGAGSAPAKRRGRKPKKAAAKRRRRSAKKKTAKKAVKKAPRKAVKKAAKKATKKAKNKRSLKDVVLQVTKGKALTAAQILEATKKAGHKFGGKKPINSLRVMLYNNKKAFKQPSKGKFTAA